MRWVVHVVSMAEVRNTYTVSIETPEGKKFSEELVANERILLKCILRN
jgi:hypothetical protein